MGRRVKETIKKVNTGRHFFTPSLRMVIGVPSGSTEVELRAVRDSAEHAGGRDVYLIFYSLFIFYSALPKTIF